MNQPLQYPKVTQQVTIGKGETLTTRTDIVPQFVPLTISLTRMAWEKVALTAIRIEGEPMPCSPLMGGDEQVFDLPPSDPNTTRRLELTWINRSRGSAHFSFTLSEAPIEVMLARPVPNGPAIPRALPIAPTPAPAPMIARTPAPQVTSPVAEANPFGRGLPVAHVQSEPAHVAPAPYAPPAYGAPPVAAPPRVIGPPVGLSPAQPPTDVEVTLAQAFGIKWESVRHISSNLGQKYRLEPAAMLAFFGADGHTTIEAEWLEQTKRQALRSNLNPGEFQFAQVMLGVARTMSETNEFRELLETAEASKPAVVGQDFKVTTATVGKDGHVQVVEHLPPAPPGPRATGADLKVIAARFGVQAEWLLVAVKSVAQLRAMAPDELVAELTGGMIRAATQLVEPELTAALEVEDPEPGSDAARFRDVSPELQPGVRAQLLATRAIDWVAREHQREATQQKDVQP